MAKMNVPATLEKLKAMGYLVYAWKEGEKIPEGLNEYIEARAGKMAAEEVDKFIREHKEAEARARDAREYSAGNLDGRDTALQPPYVSSKFWAADQVIKQLYHFPPSDQNAILKLVTQTVEAERDDKIKMLQMEKAQIDFNMKTLDRALMELTTAQDQLNEK